MLYTITFGVVLVFILFCYFYVKSLVLKALCLSPSLSVFRCFSSFLSSCEFVVFALARKWNLSCTAVESPYVDRRVLRLFLLSRAEGKFNRQKKFPHLLAVAVAKSVPESRYQSSNPLTIY